jgi:lipopolysaccharide cholinephosphotransferase
MNRKDIMNDIARSTNLLREVTPNEADKLRGILLMMYKDIANFCAENKLTIMLGGGSALGAVRHSGFIPWDDDLDLMMYRPDYDKLIQLLENGALSEKYEYASPNPNVEVGARFLKIYLKGTKAEEIGESKSPTPKGIKIDIFSIVDVPQNGLVRWINGIVSNFLALTFSCATQYKYFDELEKQFAKQSQSAYFMSLTMRTIGFLSSFLPCRKWADLFDKHSASYHKKGLVAMPSGRKHYLGEVHPYDVMLPVSKGIFEGLEINLPHNVDAYLTKLYGPTYMQLPPEDKRERHFIVNLDFGAY